MRTLGLDCSTQSLTGLVLDGHARAAVAREGVVFDLELPEYKTRNGQLPDSDPKVGQAPPLMWLAALDLLLARLAAETDLTLIRAVAVSGQQHGSVYLNEAAPRILRSLDTNRDLASQVEPALARLVAPIWTDSTTTEECAEIRCALGGPLAAAEITGSDVFERFTGPQIRRFAKLDPDSWQATSSVALVSSFLTSVLAGRIAPIDQSDGSGMNLMNLRARQWSRRAVDATFRGLAERLPEVVDCDFIVGPIASYFSRYGLAKCTTVVGSGDNPSSLVGAGAIEPGDIVISLGTSDTFFGLMRDFEREPTGQGHVFVAPTGDFMSLLCFRNGSLAREAVRDAYSLDWPAFDRAVLSTPPGNLGRGMVPWFEAEIVPRVEGAGAYGPHRFGGLDPSDVAANCRAVIEGQAIAMRRYSGWMTTAAKRIAATGGAARNSTILQIFADVFGCPVERSESVDSAALGAALRARHAEVRRRGNASRWREGIHRLPAQSVTRVEPRSETAAAYRSLIERYRVAESKGRTGAP